MNGKELNLVIDRAEDEYQKLKDKVIEQGLEIERLNKENKILRENAEHNDKVVDKVNWGNKRLNNIINELEKNKEKQINEYEILVLKIERYLNCYQYFLETQEENNKKIANMIHEFSLGSDKE